MRLLWVKIKIKLLTYIYALARLLEDKKPSNTHNNTCNADYGQAPSIELLTTSFQGDRFAEESEKWPKWTMDVNVNPPQPVKNNLRANILMREESFGGLLIDKDREHAYRLNPAGYHVLKLLYRGESSNHIFCNEQDAQVFFTELKTLGLFEHAKD